MDDGAVKDFQEAGCADGILCFSALLGFFGKAVDPVQLRHDLGLGGRIPVASDILKAAKALFVKAGAVRVRVDRHF